MKKDTEKFLKYFLGFFIAVVIFLFLTNAFGIINGFLDAFK
jgi:hypothetical protein